MWTNESTSNHWALLALCVMLNRCALPQNKKYFYWVTAASIAEWKPQLYQQTDVLAESLQRHLINGPVIQSTAVP